MPKLTLLANSEKDIAVTGRFLSIVNASANFVVSSPEIGSLIGEVNRQFELESVRAVVFRNESASDIDIEYETSNIKVHASGKGAVAISNEVVVKRIVEAIQVNASATVEDGKMAKNTSNNFSPIPVNKQSVADGQTVELFASRAALNRLVAIQLITDNADMGKICISNTSARATAKEGFFVQGNLDAPAGYEWETETAVYVHNYSGHAITLAGGEMWRA